MKYSVQLTQRETDLFTSMGIIITGADDNEYFNLPQWFKCLGNNLYEVSDFEELPESVKEMYNSFLSEKPETISQETFY